MPGIRLMHANSMVGCYLLLLMPKLLDADFAISRRLLTLRPATNALHDLYRLVVDACLMIQAPNIGIFNYLSIFGVAILALMPDKQYNRTRNFYLCNKH